MAGYYETQVRRAMLTVGDTDVLNEMAAGWRSSIPALRQVEDELTAGIRGLRGHDQLGEQTRDAAVGAFRDLREHLVEQRRLLGRTSQALDAAGEVIGQVKALVRVWDRVGAPRPPGPAPQPTADSDQTAYLAAATLHHRASARHAFQVQQREEEAREAWEALNRVFEESEDKIRSAHGIPRETPTNEPEPVWPPHGWPGPPPPEPDPDWPVLPPWPPVRTTDPVGPGHGPGTGPGQGPGVVPGVVPGADPGSAHPLPAGGAPQPGHQPQPPGWGHDAPPSTTVAGTPQGGVAYASGGPATAAGFAAPTAPAGAGMPPLAMPGAGGMAGTAAAGAGVAGAGARASAGAGAGAGAGAARAGQSGGASGRGSRAGRTAAGAVGGKGSQQASGRAKAGQGRGAGAARGASAGAAGSRGGRRKDRSAPSRDDLLGTDDHWLDDEGTAPDVLR